MGFNIEEVKLQGKEKAAVKVNLTYKDQQPILQSLTMVKKDGEWKVYIPPRRKQ
ncbi:Lumazine-binding domain protein [compost metagenome]